MRDTRSERRHRTRRVDASARRQPAAIRIEATHARRDLARTAAFAAARVFMTSSISGMVAASAHRDIDAIAGIRIHRIDGGSAAP